MKSTLMPVPSGKIASVVTSLEMRRPPINRPTSANGLKEISVHRVRHPTVDWYRSLYHRIGAEWMWYTRLRLSDRDLATTIEDPLVEVYALRTGDKDKGLLDIDWRRAPEVELTFFGITADLYRSGASRVLMNYALQRVWSQSPHRLWLRTSTMDHPRALRFYINSGFVPYARTVEIDDDPRLEGLLPIWAAPHIPVIESEAQRSLAPQIQEPSRSLSVGETRRQ